MGSTSNKDINSRNLKTLKDEEQVRQRPTIIFGTNDEYGAAHGVQEVIDNSADEAKEGYGKVVRISIDEDGSVTVEDDGRGLPMHYNDSEHEWNWKLALCTLYSSGKYDSSQYGNSAGLNGLGLTATQFASEYMDVTSTYGGKSYHMHFEKGRPVGNLKVTEPVREGTGTTIKFKPDVDVFPALRTKTLPADYFLQMARRKAMLNPGLTFEFKHHDLSKAVIVEFPNGVPDFFDKLVDKKVLKESAVYTDSTVGTDDPELYPETYKLDMGLTFNFTSDEQSFIEIYHNDTYLFKTGKNMTVDAFKEAVALAMSDDAKENGKMSRSDGFKFKDIEPMLICVGTTEAPGYRTWFENQTKGAILNTFIRDSFTQFVYNSFRHWLSTNKEVAGKIITQALANKEAREEADKVSKKLVQKLSKGVSFGNKPKKFIDCDATIPAMKEIYLVEGDSAASSTTTARDHTFQAIFPLRGKPINCLKEKLTRVLNNDIIVDIFRILGCGIEAKSDLVDLPPFDINKLNFGKVIICTDADLDGSHIRTLLLTMFYVLAPSLLKAGKVYIAETPLFDISYRDTHRFAFSDKQRAEVIKSFTDEGIAEKQLKIERSKGLGENDSDMMWDSTMNPLTRHLRPIEYPENEEMLAEYFNALLGDNLEMRKTLIEEYFDVTETNID